jgi:hypothetical protein
MERYRRREAIIAAAAGRSRPRPASLPLENYEKELIAKDRLAKRRYKASLAVEV